LADISDIQAAQSVKLIGCDNTGLETAPISSGSNGNPTPLTLLYSSTPDTIIPSGALGALNANVSISMEGLTGVGFQINAGTLVGTLTPEVSIDGGTTWLATTFYDISLQAVVNTVTFSSNNTLKILTVITIGGTSHARVRVSSYTSGTANAILRVSHGVSVSLTPSGGGGGGAAFATVSNTTPTIPNNTATLIISANASRKYLNISNPSGSLCYVGFGNSTGLTTSSGLPIAARTFYELKGDNLFTGDIYAISASSITFYLCEGTP
jgi:hypothetical protein